MDRELVIDIMCYAKNKNPFEYNDYEWFGFVLDTLEDIKNNNLDKHIKYFENEILSYAEDMEEYELSWARDIFNRLVQLKLDHWNNINQKAREVLDKVENNDCINWLNVTTKGIDKD